MTLDKRTNHEHNKQQDLNNKKDLVMSEVSVLDYAKDIFGFLMIGAIIWGISLLSSGTLFVQV